MRLTKDKSDGIPSLRWMPVVLTEASDDKITDVPYYFSKDKGYEVSRPSFVAGMRSAPGLCFLNPGAAVTIAATSVALTLLVKRLVK